MCMKSPGTVRLRDHPKLTHREIPTWPPQWVSLNGSQTLFATGEEGTLLRVEYRQVDASLPERLVLVINREMETYLGVLIVDDAAVVPRLYDTLQRCCGQTLREVGDVELPVRE